MNVKQTEKQDKIIRFSFWLRKLKESLSIYILNTFKILQSTEFEPSSLLLARLERLPIGPQVSHLAENIYVYELPTIKKRRLTLEVWALLTID